jgi:hypothetical protein
LVPEIRDAEHVEMWETAARSEPLDWGEAFREYRATVDRPAAAFYEKLMERYPDATVILTVRDPERWYESALTTIYGIQKTATSPIFSLGALFVPRMKRMKRAALMAAHVHGTLLSGTALVYAL